MATNNAPKHDFAPAWLKITNSDNSKASNTNTKQGKRFSSGVGSKFRHHAVDDDYYGYSYSPYNYSYNGYEYPDNYGMHYISQPSLIRPGGQRDTKYQHPHARYGAGQGMNGGYPPYYEFLPTYEYYGNDPYYNYQAQQTSSKKTYNEKDGRRDKDEKIDKESEKDEPFNEDFPSLNGDIEKTSKGNRKLTGTGVWDGPSNSKTNGIKSLVDGLGTNSHSKVLRDVSIYKNLVPNKGGSPLITPPKDILNTQLVTQPKTLSDKKSHFLKSLRSDDNERIQEKMEDRRLSDSEELVNGVNNLGLAENGNQLSSSLEAEQRLLREMGWNEADEEDYEITEDDMKEFQNLTKQVQQQRSGFGQGISKIWSPKHIPDYQPYVEDLNETLSSSDSDSDNADN